MRPSLYTKTVKDALREDIGRGDVTTKFFLPPGIRFTGTVTAKEPGVICGTKIAETAFRLVSKSCKVRILAADGTTVKAGDAVMTVTGDRNIMTAERVALNFLQRLSGIATLTAAFARRVKGTGAKIFDTRKTTPGLRLLEKYAVKCGGGENHRKGLYDAVLIKDNHLEGIKAGGQGTRKDMERRIASARENSPGITIEMEAQNLKQVRLALDCGVDIVLLDNMPVKMLRAAIKTVRAAPPRSRPEVEISGGVTLGTVRVLSGLGPERISVGQITHSAKALDISFDLETYK